MERYLLKLTYSPDRKTQQLTGGLAILGQDIVNFIFSNMAAVVTAGQTSLGICRLSCTFVFQSAAVTGGRFSNPPTSPSPIVIGHFSGSVQLLSRQDTTTIKFQRHERNHLPKL